MAIPPKINEDNLIKNDILEIRPSRVLEKLEYFIYDIIKDIDNYGAEYILINTRDYMDLIWFFTNQNGGFIYPEKLAGAKIIIAPVYKPTPTDSPKQEVINWYRKNNKMA